MDISPEFAKQAIVPVDPSEADPDRRGAITIGYRDDKEPTGLFSFVFYTYPGTRSESMEKYLIGLRFYLRLIEETEFHGWKLIIYTTPLTLKAIQERDKSAARTLAVELFNHERIILAVVDWPEYHNRRAPGSIEDTVMRCLRYHAFVQFPDIPVYVRDADTTFSLETDITDKKRADKAYENNSPFERYFKRAYTAFNEEHRHTYPMLYGTSIEYSRSWHTNARLPARDDYREGESLGLYAGMLSCAGGVREWKDGSLWALSLEYLRSICTFKRIEYKFPGSPQFNFAKNDFSNINTSTKLRIGKDEQLPIFVWYPILSKRIFFYHYTYARPNPLIYWESSRGEPFSTAYKLLTKKYPKLTKISTRYNQTKFLSTDEHFLKDPKQRLADLDTVLFKRGNLGDMTGEIESKEAWEEAQKKLLASWVEGGYTDKNDPALKYTVLHRHPKAFAGQYPIDSEKFHELNHQFSNEVIEYEVTEPFRNRLYHDFISFVFRAFLDQYQAVCEREGVETDYTRSTLKNAIRAEMRAIQALPAPELPAPPPRTAPIGNLMAAFGFPASGVSLWEPPKGGQRLARKSRRKGRSARKTLRKRR